jgi:hypothetical protein
MKRILYNIYKVFEFAFTNKNKVYFHGKEKKSIVKFIDQIKWLLNEHQFNNYYYCYGLNLKGIYQTDYLGKRKFSKISQNYNKKIIRKYGLTENASILTKDKFYAASILKNQGIPVIKNLGLISNGKILVSSGSIFPIEKVFTQFSLPLLIKNTLLEYNEGILIIENNTKGEYLVNGEVCNFKEILYKISTGNWVIQNPEASSSAIRKINNSALNTTRIVTIIKNENPEYIGGFQAFATEQQRTDSWGKGAIYVGFDHEREILKKNGFYHPNVTNHSVVNKHPNSDVVFDGYKIDGLHEAVKLCKNAHMLFYYTPIIGWDVAITDEGPKILEANEKPGMNAVQAINSNIKKKLIL